MQTLVNPRILDDHEETKFLVRVSKKKLKPEYQIGEQTGYNGKCDS